METWKLLLFFQMSIFACFLTDNFHIIIYSICLNFISNNSLICRLQDGFLFWHNSQSGKGSKRHILFIALFSIEWHSRLLFLPVPLSRRGVMDICNLELRLKSLNFRDHWRNIHVYTIWNKICVSNSLQISKIGIIRATRMNIRHVVIRHVVVFLHIRRIYLWKMQTYIRDRTQQTYWTTTCNKSTCISTCPNYCYIRPLVMGLLPLHKVFLDL